LRATVVRRTHREWGLASDGLDDQSDACLRSIAAFLQQPPHAQGYAVILLALLPTLPT